MTEPDPAALAAAKRALTAAKAAVDEATSVEATARAALGAAILAAREAGMTVPAVADHLEWSEANVFRVSAQAKKAAAGPSPTA